MGYKTLPILLADLSKPTLKTYKKLFKLAEQNPQVRKYLFDYFDHIDKYIKNPDEISDPILRALVKGIMNTEVGYVKLAFFEDLKNLIKGPKQLKIASSNSGAITKISGMGSGTTDVKSLTATVVGLTGLLNLLNAFHNLKPFIEERRVFSNYTPSQIYKMLIGVDPEIKQLPKGEVLKGIASVLMTAPSLVQNLSTLATTVKSLAYGKTGIPLETYTKLRTELGGLTSENLGQAIRSLREYLSTLPLQLANKDYEGE